MQQTIDKLQNQINKPINLVTELTNSVMSDETKKLEIMELMKSIKDVKKSNESLEVQHVQIVNNEEIENLNAQVVQMENNEAKTTNNEDAGKRKDHSKKTMPHHNITNDEETTSSVSHLIRWCNDKNQRKRSKPNNE